MRTPGGPNELGEFEAPDDPMVALRQARRIYPHADSFRTTLVVEPVVAMRLYVVHAGNEVALVESSSEADAIASMLLHVYRGELPVRATARPIVPEGRAGRVHWHAVLKSE